MMDKWIPAINQHPANDQYILDNKKLVWAVAVDYLIEECGFSENQAINYLHSLDAL